MSSESCERPRVSVILNCYNHEKFVSEALKSILAQSFKDFEVILIDNGSTDNTRKVLDGFVDSRIRRFYFDHNESLSKRLNQAIKSVKGDFTCILYSDDLMLPNKLEHQLGLFERLEADYGVVYCPSVRMNDSTLERWTTPSIGKSGEFLSLLIKRFLDGPPDMSSPLIRTECFRSYSWHEDLFSDGEAIFFRIAISWKFFFDAEPTVILRDHYNNVGKAIIKNHDMMMQILERLTDDPNFPDALLDSVGFLRASLSRNNAWVSLRMGTEDIKWVKQQLFNTLKIAPRAALHPRWFGAVVLAIVPPRFRAVLNHIGRLIKKTKEHSNAIDVY